MKKRLPISLLSLALAFTVVLNGAHAKDVLNNIADSQGGSKIAADLHPHVDKQIHKISNDAPQLDGRSLRLRDFKKSQLNFKNWLDSWRDQFALLLS